MNVSLMRLIRSRSRSRPYDSGESRRSPRERSPAPQRYSDSRDSGQQRGAPYRINDGPSRPSSDSRSNSDVFSSSRDTFRVGLAPPRAPKAFPDAPTGPRANSFTGDSRGRGGGRGRGRGWHDEMRDRGEYDYRDRRDDRAAPPFRGDRGRERDWMDRDRRDRDGPGFRGRRPSSPGSGYLRGRGRARGDWDSRGHGRSYDDRERFRARSRSPPSRRASLASPPPQAPEIPAYGSVITHAPAASTNSDNLQAMPTTAMTIPTGPRSTRDLPPQKNWQLGSGRVSHYGTQQFPRSSSTAQSLEMPQVSKAPTKSTAIADLVTDKTASNTQLPPNMPVFGDTMVKFRVHLPRDTTLEEDDSDSESGEDMDDYFEAETRKFQEKLAQTSLDGIYRSFTYAFQDAVASYPFPESPESLLDDGNEVEPPNPPILEPIPKPTPVMPIYQSDGDESDVEYAEQLASVRRQMKTPPVSSLPFRPIKPWWENTGFLQEINDAAAHQSFLEEEMAEKARLKEEHTRKLRREYASHYKRYLEFCESDDPAAVNYRAKIAANERSTSRATSLTPATDGRPEGRRAASRFATEHDIARVIQESKREAQEKQERSERAAKAKAASDKEAIIPDMIPEYEYQVFHFADTSHKVSFDRAPAILGILPPVDNFTEEECETFEKTYMEFPKQWSKIAAALSGRDYKNCIQHYYLVKHKDNLKEKLKKKEKGKKKGRASSAASKPKSNALMANLGSRDGETDDGQDNVDGERRRPRRAAAPIWPIEPPSESENATPTPTPGRRAASTNKGDTGSESGPTKRKAKSSSTRDKGPKQPKNGQPLVAAPPAPSKTRDDDKKLPSGQITEKAQPRVSSEPNRFISQFEGPPQNTNAYPTARVPHELVAGPASGVDKIFFSYGDQEPVESAPVSVPFETQHHDRRNSPQTTSYWSVPEQTDFPALLQHFGTDWQAISKWMGSKTPTMVKNYYQRQIDSGRLDLEDIARNADGRKARGESTGPPPTPTMSMKRRYDGPGTALQRPAAPAIETTDDLIPTHQPMITQNASSPKQPTTSRFPALQAGPVPQASQPSRTISAPNKIPQSQHQPQQWAQQVIQSRGGLGPQLGYFSAPDRERPILQAASTQHQQPSVTHPDPLRVQRPHMTYEAQLEKDQTMQRLKEQAHHQNFRLKKETEIQNLSQYEPYSTQPQQPNIIARSRIEEPSNYGSDMRRTAPTQQYNPRSIPREVGSDTTSSEPSGLIPNPPPQISRPAITPTQVHQEPPVTLRPQPPAISTTRQQETVRKTSSIMSLLNDEPSEPKVPPPKRNSDGPPATVQPSLIPATQPPLYPPARSLSGGQSGQAHNKTPLGDIHGTSQGYPRSAGSSQGLMRAETHFSAAVQPQTQSRSQIGSPMDSQSTLDRDSYTQQPYNMQLQQPAASTPQPGPQYQPAQQSHRQMAFSSSTNRTSSPPGQYAPLHASRHSSFEGHYSHHVTSSLAPQMHYSPSPSGPSVTMPYQSAPPAHHLRFTAPTSQGQSQMSQQMSSQHQQSSQHAYAPLPPQSVQQHTKPIVSAPSYSPPPYDPRENFRPRPQQQQQTLLRQQIPQQQQQQQRDDDPYHQRRLEERRYEDSRRA